MLVDALWPLGLAVALGLATRRFRSAAGPAPGAWLDIALAVASGVAFAAVAWAVLWRFHLRNATLSSGDFVEYCDTIGRMRSRSAEFWSATRSWPSYALPGLLSEPLGVIDGLVAGAIASSAVMGAALYTWARALHSRAAGLFAPAVALGFGPLALMARTPSFYPEVAAFFAVCAAAVAVAIRGRGLVSFMVAAATVGVALLMDLRGLAWGLACGGALALAALREDRKGGALRLALLLGGLSASYAAGEAAYGDLGVSLEERGDVHRLEMETGRAPPELPKPPPVDRGYIWGRTPLRQLPDTLATLVASARAAPAEGFVARDLAFAGAQHDAMQAAIAGFAGFAVLVGAVGLRRRPWQALAWFGTSLPFAACTWAALRMVSWHPRFLLLGLPALAVGMGVALATLCLAGDRQESGGRIGWLHLALVGVLAWALPMSWIPSPLSVRAGWQSPYGADEEPLQLWRQAVAGSQGAPRDAECRGYLRADADRGIEPSLWGDPLR